MTYMRDLGVQWTIELPLSSQQNNQQNNQKQQQQQQQSKDSVKSHNEPNSAIYHGGDTALVTIAVGEKSRAFGKILVRSFLLHGEFAGPLYIVTDDVEYFYQGLFVRLFLRIFFNI